MKRTNRNWLPAYCDPQSYLPKIQETGTLFARKPYIFTDFVGRALCYLQSEEVRKIGFEYDTKNNLPCKWKCADESVFGVDLALYAYTGQYPFDKGMIGGRFNADSLRAAVHHGRVNIDFGGSHVGYLPGKRGGQFGHIWRPLHHAHSTDCGSLMAQLAPFKAAYDDACSNILLFKPPNDRVLLSIPNEYVQPSWCVDPIKLLVDTETLTDGEVPYDSNRPHTHTPIGRTLFYLKPGLLDQLADDQVVRFHGATPAPIGHHLTYHFFNIFDADTVLDLLGLPQQKLHLYMKFILSAQNSPVPLKAAIVNTNLEYNRLTDAVRAPAFTPYSFASFTGVFIDMYIEEVTSYVNLFQPLGLSIKPGGANHIVEIPPDELHEIIGKLKPIEPVHPIGGVLGYDQARDYSSLFTFEPGLFNPDSELAPPGASFSST